jgi:hypothetical protein
MLMHIQARLPATIRRISMYNSRWGRAESNRRRQPFQCGPKLDFCRFSVSVCKSRELQKQHVFHS